MVDDNIPPEGPGIDDPRPNDDAAPDTMADLADDQRGDSFDEVDTEDVDANKLSDVVPPEENDGTE